MKTKLTEKLITFCGFIVIVALTNCTKPNTDTPTPPLSSEKNITSFSFKVANNPTLTADVIGNINSDSIFITMPFGTAVTNLIPSITISGISISPSNLTQQDFTNPVSYLVTAKDASTKSYTVVVNIGAIEATLFISSTYPGASGGGYGKIYAIDANTGMLKWKYTTAATAIDGSSAFFNGFIYTGINSDVTCIDTTSKSIKWNFTTGAFVESTPTIVNGILYINSNDGYLYAIDAMTGNLKWKYLEGSSPPSGAGNGSSPTVVDGVVYVGSFDGYIYAIDATTGILKWKTYDSYDDGDAIESGPTVVNGILYVFGRNYFLALNTIDGSFKWESNFIGGAFSSPTIANGIVYFGSSDGNVYALDANTGKSKWSYSTFFVINASPVFSNGTIFVGVYAGAFYAIDALSGSQKWVFTYEYDFEYSPVVFNNVVYVGSYANVLAINAETGTLKWKYEIDNQFEEVRTGPCIVDKQGNIYYSGISGSQN